MVPIRIKHNQFPESSPFAFRVTSTTRPEEFYMSYVFAAFVAVTLLSQSVHAEEIEMSASHPYAGMWVTQDGHVRHELLPNGRYIEARGSRKRAYEGRYEVTGTHIEYWDDTGFTADGEFVEPDVLQHGGMILRRTANPPTRSR
jgi:hypothetical protein